MSDDDKNITGIAPAADSRRRIGGYLLKYGVPLVISVGLCWLLFKNEDLNPATMWQTICRECDFGWIGLNIAFGLLAQFCRAARWRIQLRALDIRPSLWQLTLSILGTYSVNLVFPRLGEVWRTGYIANREKAPFTTVFGSMVADRLADTLAVFILLLLTFIPAGTQLREYLGQDGGMVSKLLDLLCSPLPWCVAVAAICGCVGGCKRLPDNRLIVKAKGIVASLWDGFSVIATMRGKGLWLLLTVVLWASYITSLYCAFRSFPLTSEMISRHGLAALAVCFVFTSISMGVPSNGGIGPYQWAMMFGIALFASDIPGLTREYSLTFANLLMGVQTLVLIAQGLFTFACIALSKRSKKES